MLCWKSRGGRIRENFKLRPGISCVSPISCLDFRNSPGLEQSSRQEDIRGTTPTTTGSHIIFVRSSSEEIHSVTGHSLLTSGVESNSTKSRFQNFWLFNYLPLISFFGRRGQNNFFSSGENLESSEGATKFQNLESRRHPKMEHAELIKELSHIERLTNQERLKLAHNRRKLQLKCWNQYEKLLNNTSMGGTNKKGLTKNNQQQKIIEQLQQQEQMRKFKGKNKPKVKFRNSIMLLEAAGRNDIAEVRRLLQDGVDPDVANEDGLTALHQCCIDDNEEMMKLLVDSNANVNAEDSERWTPLHAAATCGHLHLVKHLIVKGANLLAVNAEGNMPYDICDEETTLDYIESEMSNRGVTQELIEEIRALPETRMLEDMQRIQAEDEDLEYRDKDGATYLHIAAANGYARVVEFLLDNHVATDVQDKDCWHPVHAAACWGHVEVLELLVQNGADLNARTKNNETPYAICEDLEIKERIVQLRNEQETKMKESAVKKLRRSVSSNSRTQSIRRTSQRDKGLTTKRDAADEAAMLLTIATPVKDATPSPTGDTTEPLDTLLPNHNHQSSITSSEEEHEFRSLPPWSQGRDSITQLHMEALGFPKPIPIPLDTESSSAEESPRLNNSKQHNTKGLNNLNLNNNKLMKEKNELNGSLRGKYQNPLSGGVTLPVSNPTLAIDTNSNLPKPDISPHVDLQPKLSNPTTTTGDSGLTSKISEASADGTMSGGNSTIDIRVQVTINTNSSNGSFGPTSGTVLSNGNQSQVVQVTGSSGPLYTQPGTLSDLKKHRSLQYVSISRNSTFPLDGLKDYPPKYEPPPSPTTSLKKFAGDPGEIARDYTDNRRKCCIIL